MATSIRRAMRHELVLAGLTGFLLILAAIVLVGGFVLALLGISP